MNIGWRIRRILRGDKERNRKFSDRYSLVEVTNNEENQPQVRQRKERALSIPALIMLSVVICSLLFSVTIMNTIGKSTTIMVLVKDGSEQVMCIQEAGLTPSISKFKEIVETKVGEDVDVMKYDVLGNELGGLPNIMP